MIFKQIWRLKILSAIATLAFTCSNNNAAVESASTNCQSIEHDRGTTEICDRPQKIVAIGPNMLELLLALDIQPVGYADYFALPASQSNPVYFTSAYLCRALPGAIGTEIFLEQLQEQLLPSQ